MHVLHFFMPMKLFLYEFTTAQPGLDLSPSLRQEGEAMFAAFAADASAVPGLDLSSIRHGTIGNEQQTFKSMAAEADWSLVIAPETGGILAERRRWVVEAGSSYLGPDAEALELCSDKWKTYLHWTAHGTPTPRTWLGTNFPAATSSDATPIRTVCKPRDGAGSHGICHSTSDMLGNPDSCIIQEYLPGIAASLMVLIGKNQSIRLLPASQHLADDDSYKYRGGSLPLPVQYRQRACAIVDHALKNIPGLFGCIGVDFVLGDDPHGTMDSVIEINPRPTTSYVGLRAMTEDNLLQKLLQLVEGIATESPEWKPGGVTFDSTGVLRRFA